MGRIKRLAGETILYGLGSIVPRFLNFLLVPLHTAVFNPEDYGVITKLFAYAAVVYTIFTFGMETAYFRFATKPGNDEKKVFNLAQTVVLAISVCGTLLFVLLASPIAELARVPGKTNYIYWLSAIMFIDAIVSLPFARLRLLKKPMLFAAGKLINVTILVALNVYFLKYAYTPALGVSFVMIANVIANSFYILFVFRSLVSWRPTYDKDLTPVMFTYAYPVMITGLAGMTNEMFSRTTLDLWLPEGFYEGQSSAHALGVFGACYKFSVVMTLATQAFRYAAEPFFFSSALDKDSPALFSRVNHYFVIVCCIILVGVSINMDIFQYFLRGPEFREGLFIVPILLLAGMFLGIYYNFSTWFKLTDRTYFGTIIAAGGVVVTIAANYLLIPIAGYLGSSYASLLCYFSMAIACYLLGQKFYPIPYQIGRGAAYILASIVIVYAVNQVSILNPWLATTFHVGVTLLFMGVIFLIERKEHLPARA